MDSIEFIYKAKEVHGDFYIYDETEYPSGCDFSMAPDE